MLKQISVFLIILPILTSDLRLGIGINLREIILTFTFVALEVVSDVEYAWTRTDGGVVLLAG